MPCYMCAGTIVQFKFKKVIVGRAERSQVHGPSWKVTVLR